MNQTKNDVNLDQHVTTKPNRYLGSNFCYLKLHFLGQYLKAFGKHHTQSSTAALVAGTLEGSVQAVCHYALCA